MQSIYGGIEYIIVTKDRRIVGRLHGALIYSNRIKYSKIIQVKIDHIVVKIVRNEGCTNDDKETLYLELRRRLGKDIDIDSEFVEDIPREQSGKLRFVVSSTRLQDVLLETSRFLAKKQNIKLED